MRRWVALPGAAVMGWTLGSLLAASLLANGVFWVAMAGVCR